MEDSVLKYIKRNEPCSYDEIEQEFGEEASAVLQDLWVRGDVDINVERNYVASSSSSWFIPF